MTTITTAVQEAAAITIQSAWRRKKARQIAFARWQQVQLQRFNLLALLLSGKQKDSSVVVVTTKQPSRVTMTAAIAIQTWWKNQQQHDYRQRVQTVKRKHDQLFSNNNNNKSLELLLAIVACMMLLYMERTHVDTNQMMNPDENTTQKEIQVTATRLWTLQDETESSFQANAAVLSSTLLAVHETHDFTNKRQETNDTCICFVALDFDMGTMKNATNSTDSVGTNETIPETAAASKTVALTATDSLWNVTTLKDTSIVVGTTNGNHNSTLQVEFLLPFLINPFTGQAIQPLTVFLDCVEKLQDYTGLLSCMH